MKLLPARVLTDQLRTLRNDVKSRPMATDYVVLYVLPAGIGLAGWKYGTPLMETSSILAAVAVFTGLIFNLSFSVFDKSLQIRRDPIQSADPIVIMLVEELRANVNYTVLVGIILTGILTSASIFKFNPLAGFTTGLVAAIMAHLLLMCLMVLKRFTSLHNAMKP